MEKLRSAALIDLDLCHDAERVYRTAVVSSGSLLSVAKNGDVCISILHEPGEDKFGYEKPEERWLPIHTVETIMISVISMLADPNSDSPANVDAAVSPSSLHHASCQSAGSDIECRGCCSTERVAGGPQR